MPRAGTTPQAFFVSELTTGAIIDDAFLLVRRLPRAEFLPAAAFVALLSGLCAAIAWTAEVSGDGFADPTLLRRLSVARLGLVAVETGLAAGLVRLAWRPLRGPLSPSAPLPGIVIGIVTLAASTACLTFLPEWLMAAGDLQAGTRTLLAGEGLVDGRWLVAGIATLLILPFVSLAPAALCVEGGSATQALLRSIRLAVASGLRVHLLISALWLLRISLAAGLAFLFVGFDAFDPETEPMQRRAALGCSALVVQGLLVVPTQLACFLAYVDARVRHEGLDVERDARLAGLVEDDPS
ncbi:MAG: hypothetical protein CMJ83_11725 [Planctomycetes bacterium]|nr:hypothetical protein [Planctomycetota bacterium]